MKEIDVVELLVDVPEEGLKAGETGTVVLELDEDTVEVEFVDDEGYTTAQLPLRRDQLRVTWSYEG
ncbi:DUF4926 domain-containing protein [Natronoglycomyces albus]|uniref:DUF4926 domain-containing protein n=1 Tax=Natronoglycomyces albus TaxID=2811108 RepID=A0A895XRF3_9ACTN|nr:DUF4926 domain-containing protein [Natronoglycomyces albus]QSB05755.1 DUF4926 domain-containing protein [Natronoglycomyces albus]